MDMGKRSNEILYEMARGKALKVNEEERDFLLIM